MKFPIRIRGLSAWTLIQALAFSGIPCPFAFAEADSLRGEAAHQSGAKTGLESNLRAPQRAGLEETADLKTFREEPTYENYRRLTDASKGSLRGQVAATFQPMPALQYPDFAYNKRDYSVEDRIRDLLATAQRTREILEREYRDEPQLQLVALGDSAALLVRALEAMDRVGQKGAFARGYAYSSVVISRVRKEPSPEQKAAYKKYLEKVLDPVSLVRRRGVTVLLDSVFSGDTYRLFLDLLEELAGDQGIDPLLLRQKIVLHAIEGEYDENAGDTLPRPFQNLHYRHTTQTLRHRLFRSLTAPESQFGDRMVSPLSLSDWTRLEELGPTLTQPSGNAILTLFALYDQIAATPQAGLEEGQLLEQAVDLKSVPVSYPAEMGQDLSDAKTVLVTADAGRGTRFDSTGQQLKMIALLKDPVRGTLPSGVRTKLFARDLGWPVISVVGYEKGKVMDAYRAHMPEIIFVEVENPTGGTGYAIYHGAAVKGLRDSNALVIATMGDQPLYDRQVLESVEKAYRDSGADLVIATAIFADPKGKGRIVRDAKGQVLGILEEEDIKAGTTLGGYTMEQLLAIHECNVSIYAMKAKHLFDELAATTNNNAQSQFYLTDIVRMVLDQDGRVETVLIDPAKAPDLTTQADLEQVEATLAAQAQQTQAGLEEIQVQAPTVQELTLAIGSENEAEEWVKAGVGLLSRRSLQSDVPASEEQVLGWAMPEHWPTPERVLHFLNGAPPVVVLGGGHGTDLVAESLKRVGVDAVLWANVLDTWGRAGRFRAEVLAQRGVNPVDMADPMNLRGEGLIRELLKLELPSEIPPGSLWELAVSRAAQKEYRQGKMEELVTGIPSMIARWEEEQGPLGSQGRAALVRFLAFLQQVFEVVDAELIQKDYIAVSGQTLQNLLDVGAKVMVGAYPRGGPIDTEKYLVAEYLLREAVGGPWVLPTTFESPQIVTVHGDLRTGRAHATVRRGLGTVGLVVPPVGDPKSLEILSDLVAGPNGEPVSAQKAQQLLEQMLRSPKDRASVLLGPGAYRFVSGKGQPPFAANPLFLRQIRRAELVVIAPGNFHESVASILSIPGVIQALIDAKKRGATIIWMVNPDNLLFTIRYNIVDYRKAMEGIIQSQVPTATLSQVVSIVMLGQRHPKGPSPEVMEGKTFDWLARQNPGAYQRVFHLHPRGPVKLKDAEKTFPGIQVVRLPLTEAVPREVKGIRVLQPAYRPEQLAQRWEALLPPALKGMERLAWDPPADEIWIDLDRAGAPDGKAQADPEVLRLCGEYLALGGKGGFLSNRADQNLRQRAQEGTGPLQHMGRNGTRWLKEEFPELVTQRMGSGEFTIDRIVAAIQSAEWGPIPGLNIGGELEDPVIPPANPDMDLYRLGDLNLYVMQEGQGPKLYGIVQLRPNGLAENALESAGREVRSRLVKAFGETLVGPFLDTSIDLYAFGKDDFLRHRKGKVVFLDDADAAGLSMSQEGITTVLVGEPQEELPGSVIRCPTLGPAGVCEILKIEIAKRRAAALLGGWEAVLDQLVNRLPQTSNRSVIQALSDLAGAAAGLEERRPTNKEAESGAGRETVSAPGTREAQAPDVGVYLSMGAFKVGVGVGEKDGARAASEIATEYFTWEKLKNMYPDFGQDTDERWAAQVIAALIQKTLREDLDAQPENLKEVGISFGGVVGPLTVQNAKIVGFRKPTPFKQLLGEELYSLFGRELPIRIVSEDEARVWGEFLWEEGALKGLQQGMVLTLGTGTSIGVLQGGKPIDSLPGQEVGGLLGEFGWSVMRQADGPWVYHFPKEGRLPDPQPEEEPAEKEFGGPWLAARTIEFLRNNDLYRLSDAEIDRLFGGPVTQNLTEDDLPGAHRPILADEKLQLIVLQGITQRALNDSTIHGRLARQFLEQVGTELGQVLRVYLDAYAGQPFTQGPIVLAGSIGQLWGLPPEESGKPDIFLEAIQQSLGGNVTVVRSKMGFEGEFAVFVHPQSEVVAGPEEWLGPIDWSKWAEVTDPDRTLIQSFSGVRADLGPNVDPPILAPLADVKLSPAQKLIFARYGYLFAKLQIEKFSGRSEFTFIFGRDPRPTGRAIQEAHMRGISVAAQEFNVKVRFVEVEGGILPTPLSESLVRLVEAHGGGIITASHNPLRWNGVKYPTAATEPAGSLVEGGILLPSRQMKSVVDQFRRWAAQAGASPEQAQEFVQRLNAVPVGRLETVSREKILGQVVKEARQMWGLEQEEEFQGFREKAKRVRIVVDPNGGAATGYYAEFLERMGFDLIEINHVVGQPQHILEPVNDPEKGNALADAERVLKEAQAHFAIITDYDADRANTLLLDPKTGQAVEPNPQEVAAMNMALGLARAARARPAGDASKLAVVAHSATSKRVLEIAKAFGAEVFPVEVGEVNVLEKMRKLEAQKDAGGRPTYRVVLGIEGANGGTVFRGESAQFLGDTSRNGAMTALFLGMVATDPEWARSWLQARNAAVPNGVPPVEVPAVPTLLDILGSLPGDRSEGSWRFSTPIRDQGAQGEVPEALMIPFKRAWETLWKENLRDRLQKEGLILADGTSVHPTADYRIVYDSETGLSPAYGPADPAGAGLTLPSENGTPFGMGGWIMELELDGGKAFVWLRGSLTEGMLRIATEGQGARAKQVAEALRKLVDEEWYPKALAQARVKAQPATAGLEELQIRLKPGVTAGKVIFLGPEVATEEVLQGLAQLKPVPGEQINLVIFAEHVHHAGQIEGWLKDTGLAAKIINLKSPPYADKDPSDVITKMQVDAIGRGLDVLTIWTPSGLSGLGDFLEIEDVSFRTWQKRLERQPELYL